MYLHKRDLNLSLDSCKSSFLTPSSPVDLDLGVFMRICKKSSIEQSFQSTLGSELGINASCTSSSSAHLGCHCSRWSTIFSLSKYCLLIPLRRAAILMIF
eukprot:NODE_716_length_4503_cov_0.446639.p5 type:complete len:100 gc:universal NODE_716_length_4503_cov_0.446639:2567-2268(-)